jgi:glycosyltransferase involved in cell wall biosynthesis
MMKPCVLQLIETFHLGGSESQAVQLTRLLHLSGAYRVQVACLDGRGVLRDEVDSLGLGEIPEYQLTSFYDANFAAQVLRFAQHLRRQKVALVHTHDFYTNIFGMAGAALAGVPVRIAVRRESGKRAAIKRRFERVAYRLSHAVLANCEAVRGELIAEGIPELKVFTSYNGLDLARLTPPSVWQRDELLAELGLWQVAGRPLVTMVANLRPVKDHATFLRAAQRVRGQVPDAAFCLAGEGELLEPLRQQAAKLGLVGDIFFLGRCERVAALLAVTDVCVLSYSSEGFSNAILEYMAAARPVVATDVGGAREAVIEGVTGYVVGSGDDAAMADRIASLLLNPEQARAMGERGRLVVERNFSRESLLERIQHLYDRLLAARHVSARQPAEVFNSENKRMSQ